MFVREVWIFEEASCNEASCDGIETQLSANFRFNGLPELVSKLWSRTMDQDDGISLENLKIFS